MAADDTLATSSAKNDELTMEGQGRVGRVAITKHGRSCVQLGLYDIRHSPVLLFVSKTGRQPEHLYVSKPSPRWYADVSQKVVARSDRLDLRGLILDWIRCTQELAALSG